MKQRRKIRVIVRPWIPRKTVTSIPLAKVEEIIRGNYKKLKPVLYVGWGKRILDGKRTIVYLVATGTSSKEARSTFKKSERYGEDIWILR